MVVRVTLELRATLSPVAVWSKSPNTSVRASEGIQLGPSLPVHDFAIIWDNTDYWGFHTGRGSACDTWCVTALQA